MPMKELPDRWGDLGQFIREQRNMARLSLRRLSDMAGISNPYLSQIERGLRKPSAEILQQIARALRISAETLYVRAGILEEREGEPDLTGEILRDPFLTEEQKQMLVRIYLSFRHENEDRVMSPPVARQDDEETADGEDADLAALRQADHPASEEASGAG
jgi:transcriptional regulator with XRE-family HTH domain